MLSRSVILNERIIKENNLRTNPPPDDSFFFRAFERNRTIAENTLRTPFIQSIANDNLFPVAFGTMTAKDAQYCYNGATGFEIARICAKNR
jgi:thiaminase/transcriptional activator TenA